MWQHNIWCHWVVMRYLTSIVDGSIWHQNDNYMRDKMLYVLYVCGWVMGCFFGFTLRPTVYPKKYAHGFCFAVLCCGYTLTDFPISIRLTSLALWQSNDCPSASKATLMNMDKYFMWIHYERLHNHNKAKYNKTVCISLGIYCMFCFSLCSAVLSTISCHIAPRYNGTRLHFLSFRQITHHVKG